MWPFKKKKDDRDLVHIHEAIAASMLNHEEVMHRVPEPIHAKCSRCGKTDFKDNMVGKEEAYIGKYFELCGGFLSNGGMFKSEAKIKTVYTHKSCAKPKGKK